MRGNIDASPSAKARCDHLAHTLIVRMDHIRQSKEQRVRQSVQQRIAPFVLLKVVHRIGQADATELDRQ